MSGLQDRSRHARPAARGQPAAAVRRGDGRGETARRYGYGEIATPIFEFTEVFARTLGDTSDVVTKEMYTFEDRGGDSLTLRPENTAGIVRAFISNGLAARLPLRVFYRGPMFRYERPQKGRLRQFHQVGVELLGVADPLGDVEVIALAVDFLTALGLGDELRDRDQHAGRRGKPRRLSRPPGRIPRGSTATAYPPTVSRASSATRCASWTRRIRATGEVIAGAPRLADCAQRALARRSSRPCCAASTSWISPTR